MIFKDYQEIYLSEVVGLAVVGLADVGLANGFVSVVLSESPFTLAEKPPVEGLNQNNERVKFRNGETNLWFSFPTEPGISAAWAFGGISFLGFSGALRMLF